MERYPQQVEAAVYFCALEALNNVAKYSGASRAEVRLAQSNGDLTFEVSDDGAGFDMDRTSYGTGLRGMADRVEAIGGMLEIRSTPGRGTSVGRCRIPDLASPPSSSRFQRALLLGWVDRQRRSAWTIEVRGPQPPSSSHPTRT